MNTPALPKRCQPLQLKLLPGPISFVGNPSHVSRIFKVVTVQVMYIPWFTALAICSPNFTYDFTPAYGKGPAECE